MAEETGAESGETYEIPEDLRSNFLVAFFKMRAAQGEVRAAHERFERLLAQLDKKGELRKTMAELAPKTAQLNDARTGLNAVIAEVEKRTGKSMAGYGITTDGQLRKAPESPKIAEGITTRQARVAKHKR